MGIWGLTPEFFLEFVVQICRFWCILTEHQELGILSVGVSTFFQTSDRFSAYPMGVLGGKWGLTSPNYLPWPRICMNVRFAHIGSKDPLSYII